MEYNLQGTLTEEELEIMLRIDPRLPLVTKKIPFDLNKYSYSSTFSNCLPSCCVMGFCYWQENLPDLNIPTSREHWEQFISKCSSGTIKGVNLQKIRMNLEKQYREFIFLEKSLKSFSDLIPPFSAWRLPVVQIILYDKTFSIRERSGGTHASIISQVNMDEKSILLIDPSRTNPDEIIIESYMHMRDLAKGWKLLSNSVILLFPKILATYINIKTGKPSISKKLKQESINNYI